MLSQYIRFMVAMVACVLNLTLLSSLVFGLYALSLLAYILGSGVRSVLYAAIDALIYWHSVNLRCILQRICGLRFDAFLQPSLRQDKPYVMVINHRSHVDILIILAFFYDRIPNVKFFLKRSLLYVPFLGQFCYLMNYIFVRKIAPAVARRSPDVVYQQRETIKRQCRELTKHPVTLAVFAEGTRFSEDKQMDQKTVHFANLLSPQPAGLALAIEACADQVQELLDVTLVYDVGFVSVWLLLSGQVRTVEVHVQSYDVAKTALVGDYVKDRQFRRRFTEWMKYLWQKKDVLMGQALQRLRAKQGLCQG